MCGYLREFINIFSRLQFIQNFPNMHLMKFTGRQKNVPLSHNLPIDIDFSIAEFTHFLHLHRIA